MLVVRQMLGHMLGQVLGQGMLVRVTASGT